MIDKTGSPLTACRALLLATTGLLLPALATPALAQEAETAASSNDIIVTAQRRSEKLEEVPMSVAVVSQETLAASGVNSVRDLANVTTGFQVGNGGSYPQPAIRGVTTINAGAYENNVALFVDGLYQATPQILNMDLPNVQNIQILKGPQGTLYGRNATGGAILFNTVDPGSELEGMIEATYGRFDDKRARGYLAGPLTDQIGLVVAGTFRRTDGYFKKASRTTPGEFDGRFLGLKQESVRSKLVFDATEALRIKLAYNYTRASDPRGTVFTPIENVSTNYTAPGRTTRPRNLGEVAGDVFEIDFKQHEGALTFELDTGIGALRSTTGYSKGDTRTLFDFNGNYIPDLYSGSTITERTLQQNVDFAIDAIEGLDLVIGGNYYRIKTEQDKEPNTLYLGPASISPFTYPDPAVTATPLSAYRKSSETYFFRTKEAWAIFADATVKLTDQLSLNLGGRYSKETQDVSGYKINFSTATGAATSVPYSRNGESVLGFVPTNGASKKRSSYSKFTPRASIRYELSPGTNVYATYSKGFRGGEWNSVLPSDNPALWLDAKQETIDAYEVGFKTVGRNYRFELAGFYYDYQDLQVSFTSQVGNPPVALVILQNAPKARIKGLEASFDYQPVENLNLRSGLTYLHARYGKGFYFTGAGVNPASAAFNTNSDPLKVFQNITVSQNLSGLQMSRAPDWTAFAGFDYTIPQGDGGFRLSANAKYTSSYVVTNPSVWGGDRTYNTRVLTNPNAVPDNTELLAGTPHVGRASKQRARQSGYVLINASVTWTDPSDSYFVRLWGNNLTNEKFRTHYNPLSAGTYAPINEPVTYGAT
ncbi:MAG TPA: TonB-dependent receptor, partial [Novosphingobium sp.]|nr:TonB-dependent receptor [Novosphingobium sp.]